MLVWIVQSRLSRQLLLRPILANSVTVPGLIPSGLPPSNAIPCGMILADNRIYHGRTSSLQSKL
jgi:hypothetical protein